MTFVSLNHNIVPLAIVHQEGAKQKYAVSAGFFCHILKKLPTSALSAVAATGIDSWQKCVKKVYIERKLEAKLNTLFDAFIYAEECVYERINQAVTYHERVEYFSRKMSSLINQELMIRKKFNSLHEQQLSIKEFLELFQKNYSQAINGFKSWYCKFQYPIMLKTNNKIQKLADLYFTIKKAFFRCDTLNLALELAKVGDVTGARHLITLYYTGERNQEYQAVMTYIQLRSKRAFCYLEPPAYSGDPVDKLPKSVFKYIGSFLDSKSIKSGMLVSKTWSLILKPVQVQKWLLEQIKGYEILIRIFKDRFLEKRTNYSESAMAALEKRIKEAKSIIATLLHQTDAKEINSQLEQALHIFFGSIKFTVCSFIKDGFSKLSCHKVAYELGVNFAMHISLYDKILNRMHYPYAAKKELSFAKLQETACSQLELHPSILIDTEEHDIDMSYFIISASGRNALGVLQFLDQHFQKHNLYASFQGALSCKNLKNGLES